MSATEQTRRLGRAIEKAGLGGYLAHSSIQIDYLTGFNEGAGERFSALVVNAEGEYVLVCPALSVNQAKRSGIEDHVGLLDGIDPVPVMRDVFDRLNISGVVGFDDLMPGIHLSTLQHGFTSIPFVPAGKVFGSLSRTKSSVEIDLLNQTGRIACDAFDSVLPQLKAGLKESDVEMLLMGAMADRGGVPVFCIVAAGSNGAECHHHTDETEIRQGDVVILDFGCDVGGYKSDITRTVSFGRPSERVQEVYQLVYQAHMAARNVIRPGVTAGEVDAAARNVIEKGGFGEFFVHRTGHGLGREVHEEPYILPDSKELLQVGDVFSIEPGIYIPGEFGVRIENIVMLTEGGHHSFNSEPPSEITVL